MDKYLQCIQASTAALSILSLIVYDEHLWSGDSNGYIKKWNSEGKCIQTIDAHNDWIRNLVEFNGYLYSCSDDEGLIKKWNKKGECVIKLQAHNNWIWSMLVHDQYLYSFSADKTIKQWNIK